MKNDFDQTVEEFLKNNRLSDIVSREETGGWLLLMLNDESEKYVDARSISEFEERVQRFFA